MYQDSHGSFASWRFCTASPWLQSYRQSDITGQGVTSVAPAKTCSLGRKGPVLVRLALSNKSRGQQERHCPELNVILKCRVAGAGSGFRLPLISTGTLSHSSTTPAHSLILNRITGITWGFIQANEDMTGHFLSLIYQSFILNSFLLSKSLCLYVDLITFSLSLACSLSLSLPFLSSLPAFLSVHRHRASDCARKRKDNVFIEGLLFFSLGLPGSCGSHKRHSCPQTWKGCAPLGHALTVLPRTRTSSGYSWLYI